MCVSHGAKKKKNICRAGGCTNNAVMGGVCIKHGAKRKTCSHEGCTNQIQNRGVCIRHGASRTKYICSHKDVRIYLFYEEFVQDMAHRKRRRLAAMKDVPIRHRKEEFVLGMVPRSRHAAMKDVPVLPRKEEFVSGTVHHGQKGIAVMKDVPTKLLREEYAYDMVHHGQDIFVTMRDVPIK